MKRYPLFFAYTDLIQGAGFLAGVMIQGRGLLLEEAEEVWMYGVNPGGLAGGGGSRKEALADFHEGYLSVLYDLAAEASSFKAFEAGARAFFDDTNRPRAMEWDEALLSVRQGTLEADWLNKLPAERANVGIVVTELKPASNPGEAGSHPSPTAEGLVLTNLANPSLEPVLAA